MTAPNEPIEAVTLTAHVPRLRVECVPSADQEDANIAAEKLESEGFAVVGFQFESWTLPDGEGVGYCCWITYDIGPKEEDDDDQ